ncbi:MAG TPA: hypothetical protein VFB13_17840 [Reyranella sp.]|nr:hypothetical protein [Reyranella sp.]
MAALTITAANVAWVSGPEKGDQVAGEAFTAGSQVYFNVPDGKWYKAKCNGTVNQAGQDGLGMALGSADAAGARVSIAQPGAIVAIGTGTAGHTYYPGATAGQLVEWSDLVATNKAVPAAVGVGSNQVLLLGGSYNAGSVL